MASAVASGIASCVASVTSSVASVVFDVASSAPLQPLGVASVTSGINSVTSRVASVCRCVSGMASMTHWLGHATSGMVYVVSVAAVASGGLGRN